MYCGGDVNAVDICNIHCKKNQENLFLYILCLHSIHQMKMRQ